MGTTTGRIRLDENEGLAVLTLDNPPVGALSRDLVSALLARARDDLPRGRSPLVIRSAVAGFFGVGADLKLLEQLDAGGYAEYVRLVRAAIEAVASCGRVTIAAIDGVALGGGLELALACTFRVAGPAARLGFPEVGLGMLPGATGTQRLSRLIGRDAALELLLSGRQFDAAEARRLGVVSRRAEDADAGARQWATELGRLDQGAVNAIVRCVDAALPAAESSGLAVELVEAERRFATDAAKEAIASFIARRGGKKGGR